MATQIKQHAAEMLQCDLSDMELRNGGRVGVVGSNTDLAFAEVSARAHWAVSGPIVATHSLVFERDTLDPNMPWPRGSRFRGSVS